MLQEDREFMVILHYLVSLKPDWGKKKCMKESSKVRCNQRKTEPLKDSDYSLSPLSFHLFLSLPPCVWGGGNWWERQKKRECWAGVLESEYSVWTTDPLTSHMKEAVWVAQMASQHCQMPSWSTDQQPFPAGEIQWHPHILQVCKSSFDSKMYGGGQQDG